MKQKIILERWSVVIQLVLMLATLSTLWVTIVALYKSPAYLELFNPHPVVEVRVIESDDAFNLRLMLSNQGGASAAVRRAWLQVGRRDGGNEEMLLNLRDEDRFLPPGRMVMAVASTDLGLIPSLVEDIPKESAVAYLKCVVELEVVRADGDTSSEKTYFPCLNASFQRRPPQ